MANPDENTAEARNLRFLRRLVTALTATMIGGLLVIIALIVIRFSDNRVELPDHIRLPAGAQATAFTQGRDWIAIVTEENQILIYGHNAKLRQVITIDKGQAAD